MKDRERVFNAIFKLLYNDEEEEEWKEERQSPYQLFQADNMQCSTENYESLRNVIVFDLNYNVLRFGHVEGSLFMHKFRTNIFEISSYKIRKSTQFCSSLFCLQSINGSCLEPQALSTTKTVAEHNYISMNCCAGLT